MAGVQIGLSIVAALLLLAGLCTPIAAALMVAVELILALAEPADVWRHVLLIALGIGLALLGPGAWSIDARLFGRRQVRFGERPRGSTPP
jgi:uncharacterized membrane protein YphA (DoxX/SURF4 family)